MHYGISRLIFLRKFVRFFEKMMLFFENGVIFERTGSISSFFDPKIKKVRLFSAGYYRRPRSSG